MKKFGFIGVLCVLLILAACQPNLTQLTGEKYSVNGIVKYSNGQGIEGVKISFSGDLGYVISDSEGNWSKDGLQGIVTLTPVKEGVQFAPPKISVNQAQSDITFIEYSNGDQPNDPGADDDVYEGDMLWESNLILGKKGNYSFAGVYKYENLTIGDDVTITSTGISQLVIKVKGTLTLGKNVVIGVRNGYYPDSPLNSIQSLTEANYRSIGIKEKGYNLYENTFGKGGNGGAGGSGGTGTSDYVFIGYGSYMWVYGIGGSGGGGGAGGYGGGTAGYGGNGAYGPGGNGYSGKTGNSNGGNGGYGGANTQIGVGGGGNNIGQNAKTLWSHGAGGGGGGGNGGSGASGDSGVNGAYTHVNGGGGGGGGAGGYGGGVLTIIAENIVFDAENPPKFIVSGQRQGYGGVGARGGRDGGDGQPGQGGLLIVECPSFTPNSSFWDLINTYTFASSYDTASANGGHGTVTGNPQKVFVNGETIY